MIFRFLKVQRAHLAPPTRFPRSEATKDESLPLPLTFFVIKIIYKPCYSCENNTSAPRSWFIVETPDNAPHVGRAGRPLYGRTCFFFARSNFETLNFKYYTVCIHFERRKTFQTYCPATI